jgi:tRNA modification GTPase
LFGVVAGVIVYEYANAMTDVSTIYALSSGPGRAGVAVIRVSGPAAPDALTRMTSPEVVDRRAGLRRIVHPVTGAVLDHALVLFFQSPRSETGEHVAEFQVHGGRAVVRAVLEALGTVPGCRLAEPGEFARRAFENGKLDLVEIEALADLVDAETEAQRRLALQSGGVLSTLYEGWRGRLIEIAALTEAAIDFSDEGDVGARSFEAARERAKPLLDQINRHLDDGHRGEILRDGFRVALLGAPNAGKSSLLNALARRDAAIVSEEAGTTRDVIEVRLDLGGLPVIVSDTAGIREAAGGVEQEGIRRSLAAAGAANLVLWLSESGLDSPPKEISRETIITICTKADLAVTAVTLARTSPSPLGERAGVRGSDNPTLADAKSPLIRPLATFSPRREGQAANSISAKTGAGLDELIRLIATRAAEAVGGDDTAPVLTQARHRQNLETAAASLATFLDADPGRLELRAEDVRQAAHALGRITGRVDVEDVLDQIFSRFCIGK